MLNLFKPMVIHPRLRSCRPTNATESFAADMVNKPAANREHIAENLAKSLMLVTALNPRIGYDNAVKIGAMAPAEEITLKHAAAKLCFVRPEDFDRRLAPAKTTAPGATLEGGGG